MDLTQLIELYRGPLVGLIASWGAPWVDAKEIAQDSFAEAYLNRESCRGNWEQPEVFGGWLRGVARNRHRNWARSRKRRRNHITSVEPAVLEAVAAPSDVDSSPDLEKLRAAITQLPTKQRQVILMHYLEETSIKEVAILLAISNKTVEGRLYQARRTLRRMLDGKVSSSQIGRMLLCL
ncbi:RNA polymerase sigma factor [uncultured Gimesia sp.]|uniref:RNA polymerase sigma factor n=1 Tax=uncultured Gimesia sp. TaxID=1678688 RepID=UPI0030DBE4AA|tara:strand:+ start:23686 stop:24222 length:537 start_codon:yes stop_codon:yes gene_type:complete